MKIMSLMEFNKLWHDAGYYRGKEAPKLHVCNNTVINTIEFDDYKLVWVDLDINKSIKDAYVGLIVPYYGNADGDSDLINSITAARAALSIGDL